VSPTLFPVVGKTSDSVIRFRGQSFPQGNHGFARTSLFSVVSKAEERVELQIVTHELGEVYPFNLQFKVIYSLQENKLITEYLVTNLDNQTAYFSVGAHPAFKCPFDDNHTIDDYLIEFSQKEPELYLHEITKSAFLTGTTTKLDFQNLPLSLDTFVDDAIVYSNYKSDQISLREKGSNRKINVSLTGFPWLGLWSKVGAGYICIEPWCGHSDMLGFNGDIDNKSAIEQVKIGETWQRSYSIEFAY
jgi:galactose mutarotase-like enzyme